MRDDSQEDFVVDDGVEESFTGSLIHLMEERGFMGGFMGFFH
jgi:hypothetical protein